IRTRVLRPRPHDARIQPHALRLLHFRRRNQTPGSRRAGVRAAYLPLARQSPPAPAPLPPQLVPPITALLAPGRNASGIASELGSMVVTEQVDAMRALGTDPIRKLMTPRVVATTLMVPLLTAVADFVGLIGGFIVAHFSLRLGAVQFW